MAENHDTMYLLSNHDSITSENDLHWDWGLSCRVHLYTLSKSKLKKNCSGFKFLIPRCAGVRNNFNGFAKVMSRSKRGNY